MAQVLKPPAPLELANEWRTVFLAGSIEMGNAEPWQAVVESALRDEDVLILNPRREEWDASWEQSIRNEQFRGQVEWELAGQEKADLIAMYFAPDTKPPVTVLELGLSERSGNLIVCCPAGYWRRGNVEVVCARYGIALVESLAMLCEQVQRRLRP